MNGYPFAIPYVVRIADINYGGHVANSAVLTIFQDARIAFFKALGGFSELDLGGCGIVLPEAHAYYRAEMFLHDQLQVGVRCPEVKRSSFLLEYRIERAGKVTAEGETPVVCLSGRTRKPCRVPEVFRVAVEEFAARGSA